MKFDLDKVAALLYTTAGVISVFLIGIFRFVWNFKKEMNEERAKIQNELNDIKMVSRENRKSIGGIRELQIKDKELTEKDIRNLDERIDGQSRLTKKDVDQLNAKTTVLFQKIDKVSEELKVIETQSIQNGTIVSAIKIEQKEFKNEVQSKLNAIDQKLDSLILSK